jgi:hypothetical protein
MSGSAIEHLSPEIAELLEREKDAYPEDAAMKRAVLSRVEMALVLTGAVSGPGGGGPGGATALAKGAAGGAVTAAKGTTLAKLAAVGLSAFVAGGFAGGAVVQRASYVSISPATTAPAPAPASGAPTTEVAPAPIASTTASGSEAPAPAPRASTLAAASASTVGDLTRERELIDVARAALARGKPGDAIAAAQRHAERWPRGYLTEEREVILIQALAAAGRGQEAGERAARFHRTFPRSMFGPTVDAAIGGPPSSP